MYMKALSVVLILGRICQTNPGTWAKSQQIVAQGYFHAYNTQFHNKVVYNGFIFPNIGNYISAYTLPLLLQETEDVAIL